MKHKPFTSLSRRRRRARVQHIKNLIHRERHRCGGLHYDDCITPVMHDRRLAMVRYSVPGQHAGRLLELHHFYRGG